MSNPTTNFLTGGVDLSSIFMPLSQGSAYSSNTGYTVNNNDLNTIFAAYVSGTKANPTGYTVNNTDLSDIFAKYSESRVGIDWTQKNSPVPTSDTITGFATGGSYWIVATSSNYYTSNDGGDTWSTSSFTGINQGDKVAIAGNSDGTLFCMSFNGKYYTSTNGGSSWTNQGTGPADSYVMVYSPTYGGVNHYITVYTKPETASTLSSYSTDGINWQPSTTTDLSYCASHTFKGLATDGNSKLVAIGYYSIDSSTISAYSSDNGQTWSPGNDIPNGNGDSYVIAYGNGRWVATTSSQDSRFVISSGNNWPPSWSEFSKGIGSYFTDITFNPLQHLFYASSGGGDGATYPVTESGIYKSADGENWTKVLSSPDYAPWYLKYNDIQDKFLGVGQEIEFIYTSI